MKIQNLVNLGLVASFVIGVFVGVLVMIYYQSPI